MTRLDYQPPEKRRVVRQLRGTRWLKDPDVIDTMTVEQLRTVVKQQALILRALIERELQDD